MKNALILHFTNGKPEHNWYSWVKDRLEEREWNVWLPQLPQADRPSIHRYNHFIMGNKDWKFNNESVLIGHSSGAVAVLGLLQKLSAFTVVDTCILVGAFQGDLDREDLKELYDQPLDFDLIKKKSKNIIFIHSDNDPICPFEGAKTLCNKVEGTLIWVKDAGHFTESYDERFKEFPLIVEILEGSELLT